MAKKEKSTVPAEKLAQYDALISAIPGIERKGATLPYTSINGHMFSFFDKDNQFSLRLPKADLEEFITTHNTAHSLQHGVVMKEYTLVPDELFFNNEEFKPWFIKSVEYVSGLKGKK